MLWNWYVLIIHGNNPPEVFWKFISNAAKNKTDKLLFSYTPNMSSGLNNLFKFAVTGILIFLLGSQIAKHKDEFLYLREISAVQFFIITAVVIASIITNASKLKALAGSYNIKLKNGEVLGLSSITTSLNNFFSRRVLFSPRII